jgi:hypothetical protein
MDQERARLVADALAHVKAVLGELWRETDPMVKLFLVKVVMEELMQPSEPDALDASTLLNMAYAEMSAVSELEKKAMALARARA